MSISYLLQNFSIYEIECLTQVKVKVIQLSIIFMIKRMRFCLYIFGTLETSLFCNLQGSCLLYRVATAQGKQGIWLLTFPDRENTGNFVNLIFYTGKIVPTQGKF